MRIRKVKLGYSDKYTPEQQTQIKAAILKGLNHTDDPVFKEDGGIEGWHLEWILDTDAMRGIEYTVIGGEFELDDRIEELERKATPPVNKVVNVAVPGNALLRITKVQVLTDICTDELQRHLNEGWRIVAVCPQPDQRRPDYVLGREES